MSSVSANVGGEGAPPIPPATQQSCRKKKSEVDEGFVKDIINHIDEFVHASYDEHKSCLTKTVKKLFGSMGRLGAQAPPPAQEPVVSVLPLRVNTNTD